MWPHPPIRVEHAGTVMGGTPRGRSSTCEQQDRSLSPVKLHFPSC